MKRNSEISPKQEKLIACLVTDRTAEGACRRANIAVTTYWRWMKDEQFVAEYRRARRGILENAVTRLQGLTTSAIDTLERNLNCENPSVEMRTASVVLEQAIKGLETLDVENRIEMLEALVKTREEGK
jgi:hypothetical protein